MTTLLHEQISTRAETSADDVALAMRGERMTYAELELQAGRVANALRSLGCNPGDRVCIMAPKSPSAVATMLGALKAGCPYIPLDIASPPARLVRIVAAADPAVIVVGAPAAPLLDALIEAGGVRPDVRTLGLDEDVQGERLEVSMDREALLSQLDAAPSLSIRPDATAHILFTSGSTGMPKGVEITHANVTAFLDWAIPFFGILPRDRVSGHAPLHFDLSTFDVYGSLRAGAELHLVPPESNLVPRALASLIEHEKLVQWFSVPSVLTYMASFDAVPEEGFRHLRRVIWCGDVLPTPTLMHWMRRIPHASYTNLYGPTETTIASSFHVVAVCPSDEAAPIPIGRACAGEEIVVLDKRLEPVAPGETGDLYIGGSGLSPGYWRDPEQTATAFLADPRDPAGGSRLYRTGDLARVGDDGNVFFLGRVDSQIKSRGHRIELGEIEAAVNATRIAREAAVVGVHSDDFEGTAICCALAHDDEAVVRALRTQLREALPSYMLPTRWLVLPELPKNGSGKTDRIRLRELFAQQDDRLASDTTHGAEAS
jgi:amino acid adenylation domain-containing protein